MIKWTLLDTGDVLEYDIISTITNVKGQEYALCRIPQSPFEVAVYKAVSCKPDRGDIVICVNKEEAEYRQSEWFPNG